MKCLIPFIDKVDSITSPVLFNNPFHYTPRPLCLLAAKQIQATLPEPSANEKGKMYGVLVVKTLDDQLGFLAAYSGNEQKQGDLIPFVPQVFDITNPDGFFCSGEAELNAINKSIVNAENDPLLKKLNLDLEQAIENTQILLQDAKSAMTKARLHRQIIRQKIDQQIDKEEILNKLIKESQTEKSQFNRLKKECKYQVLTKQELLNQHLKHIQALKQQRKTRSAQLQKQLFDSYKFLNANGESRSASTIFKNTALKVPPAGAGDCCAPKLLQYAYQHQLTPVALAEFWWGTSPKKEIRKHGHFYPACKSKCEPILRHMLKGLAVEETQKQHNHQSIELIYEDDTILLINKPEGLLSVPGKEDSTSVYTLVKARYPDATGPLLVHRLDMATSGLILIAKTKAAHKHLQKQFLHKTVRKKYVALLEGLIGQDTGSIYLPLRVDLEDRPRQLVCHEYGKPAHTKWEVLKRYENRTKICFYPITGRTHQLRVHAAHPKGLNTPIVGDELYGTKDKRLMLHARQITFLHPDTSKQMTFEVPEAF